MAADPSPAQAAVRRRAARDLPPAVGGDRRRQARARSPSTSTSARPAPSPTTSTPSSAGACSSAARTRPPRAPRPHRGRPPARAALSRSRRRPIRRRPRRGAVYDRPHVRCARLALLDRRRPHARCRDPDHRHAFIVAYLRKTQSPRVRPRRLADARQPGRLGARRAGRGPGGRPGAVLRAPTSATRSRPTSTRPPRRPRSWSREATGLRSLVGPGPRPRHRPRRLGARQRQQLPAPAAPAHRQARRPDGRRPSRRASRARFAGAEVGMLLGWMSTPGARPVRPARGRGPGRGVPRRPGPRVLRGPERARPREALRVPAQGVPAVARAARGHPPGAVHRRAVAAGALPRARRSRRSSPSTPTRSGSSTRSPGCSTTCARAASPLDDGGLATLLASPDQREVLDKIGGLMSLLEGHGDVTMDRAGADRIPSAHRFARVLRERRANANPAAKLLQRLLGIEAKINQYAQGEAFIAEVERLGGGPRRSSPCGAAPAGCRPSPRSASRRSGSTGCGCPTSWWADAGDRVDGPRPGRSRGDARGHRPGRAGGGRAEPRRRTRHVRLRRLERPRPPLHQATPVVPEPVMRLDG